MKNPDPIIQEAILEGETYVSATQIYQLYKFGKDQARKVFIDIEDELAAKQIAMPLCKPRVVFLSEVLKKYPLDLKKIRNAAKRKREELNK